MQILHSPFSDLQMKAVCAKVRAPANTLQNHPSHRNSHLPPPPHQPNPPTFLSPYKNGKERRGSEDSELKPRGMARALGFGAWPLARSSHIWQDSIMQRLHFRDPYPNRSQKSAPISLVHPNSGKKKKRKNKLLGRDTFRWGGGLPPEGVGLPRERGGGK